MKHLKIAMHHSGIMVRYEDDYGVAAFMLTKEQANELGRSLTFASLQPRESGYTNVIIEEPSEQEDQK